jgi:hypothetical protein
MATITTQQIRDYLADSDENNHLIDGVEFTDVRIQLAMDLAVDSYNSIPPVTMHTTPETISNSLMLYGTLWHLYNGQVALAARNQMSYSDGGLTIPIEERYQFYIQMAQFYQQQFMDMAGKDKVSRNMENAWGGPIGQGGVSTDYSSFPIW